MTTYGSQVPGSGSPMSTCRMPAKSGSALPTDRNAKGVNAAPGSFSNAEAEKMPDAEAIQALVEER